MMDSLVILVPLSVVAVFFSAWVFFRMSDSGQFDDLEGPGLRILQDDDRPKPLPDPNAEPAGDKK